MKLMYIPENKIVKALCCLAFLTASACIDAVDDYYTGGETATREGSVLEYLEKTPDYSDFVGSGQPDACRGRFEEPVGENSPGAQPYFDHDGFQP